MAKKKDQDTSLKKFLSAGKGGSFLSSKSIADLYESKGYISTGLLNLDMMLYYSDNEDDDFGKGEYGFPRGRLIQMAGTPSSFKTYISKMLAASVVRQGGVALSLTTEYDVETDFDRMFYRPEHMTLIQKMNEDPVRFEDVDGERHFFHATSTIDEARVEIGAFFNAVRKARESGFEGPGVIVIDSIANLTAKDDLENFLSPGEYKNNSYGGDSKMLRKFLNSLQKELAELDITLIAVNQVRAAIDVQNAKGHAKWKPASHEVLEHYFSVILKLVKGGNYVAAANQAGLSFKYAEPFRVIQLKKRGRDIQDKECNIMHYNTDSVYGFDDLASIVEGVGMAKFCKNGATWTFEFDEKHDNIESQSYVKQYISDNLQNYVNDKGRYAGKFACKPDEFKKVLARSLRVDEGKFITSMIDLCYKYGPAFFHMDEETPKEEE